MALGISIDSLMYHYILLLSDLSYQFGLIGFAEYEERCEIAHWLFVDGESKPDPRGGRHEERVRLRENDDIRENDGAQRQGNSGSVSAKDEDPNDRWLQFLALEDRKSVV